MKRVESVYGGPTRTSGSWPYATSREMTRGPGATKRLGLVEEENLKGRLGRVLLTLKLDMT